MLKGSWVTGQALPFRVHGCHPVSWLLIPGVCCCVSNGLFQSSLFPELCTSSSNHGCPHLGSDSHLKLNMFKTRFFLSFTLQTCPSPTVSTFSIIGSCVPQAAWAEPLGLCLTPISHTPQLTCRWTLSASPTSFQHSPLLLLASSTGSLQESALVSDSAQVWSWTSYFTSLSLSFPICKWGQQHAHHRFLKGLNKIMPTEARSLCLAFCKQYI